MRISLLETDTPPESLIGAISKIAAGIELCSTFSNPHKDESVMCNILFPGSKFTDIITVGKIVNEDAPLTLTILKERKSCSTHLAFEPNFNDF